MRLGTEHRLDVVGVVTRGEGPLDPGPVVVGLEGVEEVLDAGARIAAGGRQVSRLVPRGRRRSCPGRAAPPARRW